MKYLIVDAYLNGTGIRDKYISGYISPEEISLSDILTNRLTKWLELYWAQFYEGYPNLTIMAELDLEGVAIASAMRKDLPSDYKIEYFSDAFMKFIPI